MKKGCGANCSHHCKVSTRANKLVCSQCFWSSWIQNCFSSDSLSTGTFGSLTLGSTLTVPAPVNPCQRGNVVLEAPVRTSGLDRPAAGCGVHSWLILSRIPQTIPGYSLQGRRDRPDVGQAPYKEMHCCTPDSRGRYQADDDGNNNNNNSNNNNNNYNSITGNKKY